jgi:GNAT superfamily N-acetyltransferase
MNEYLFRKAMPKDIPFLADVVIAAEKGVSDKLSYSTLFNLSEDQARKFIIAMFEEEIDGCEFSVSSFLLAEYNGEPVAAFGGWIEGFNGEMPSRVLKSNLISYTFGRECIEFLKTKANVMNGLISEREPLALQLEYLFVSKEHRGKKLTDGLIKGLVDEGMILYPSLKKAQIQVFGNNSNAIKVYEKNGFQVASSYKATDAAVLQFLPFDEKFIMEKNF